MTTQDPETPSESPDPAARYNSADARTERADFLRTLAERIALDPRGPTAADCDNLISIADAILSMPRRVEAADISEERLGEIEREHHCYSDVCEICELLIAIPVLRKYEIPAVVAELDLASVATRALSSLEAIAAAAEKLTTPLVTVATVDPEAEIILICRICDLKPAAAKRFAGDPIHCTKSPTCQLNRSVFHRPTVELEDVNASPIATVGHRPRAVVPPGGPPTPKPRRKRDLNAEAVQHMARVSDYTLTGDGLRKAWIWFGELSRAAVRDDARLFDVIRAEEERGR